MSIPWRPTFCDAAGLRAERGAFLGPPSRGWKNTRIGGLLLVSASGPVELIYLGLGGSPNLLRHRVSVEPGGRVELDVHGRASPLLIEPNGVYVGWDGPSDPVFEILAKSVERLVPGSTRRIR